jgi:Gluconate 2-dehydrogenase subunit 3
MEHSSQLPVIQSSSARRGMTRREMVKRLLGGAGAGAIFPGVALAHPIHKHLADAALLQEADTQAAAENWSPSFLDDHQNETLVVMAERIVPGSSKAQVNRFIDLLLSVDTQEHQKRFLAALSAFEAEALNRYGHPFKDLTAELQNRILTVASTRKSGRAESGEPSWSDDSSEEPPQPVRVTLRDYFENLKGWISGAYYSSEIGMRELGWDGNYFYESFPGCQHPEGHH